MTTLPPTQDQWAIMERVIAYNDLSKLTPQERLEYYRAVCESQGLNPLTQPFLYIWINGRLVLYATRGAADQLRKRDSVSVEITARENLGEVYLVTARATDGEGRVDESIGAVSIANLSGDALANALMKCETKAKRRVTLSIVGLGWLDETEVGTIPHAEPATVDAETGEIEERDNGQTWANGDLRAFHGWLTEHGLDRDAAKRLLGVEHLAELGTLGRARAKLAQILAWPTERGAEVMQAASEAYRLTEAEILAAVSASLGRDLASIADYAGLGTMAQFKADLEAGLPVAEEVA